MGERRLLAIYQSPTGPIDISVQASLRGLKEVHSRGHTSNRVGLVVGCVLNSVGCVVLALMSLLLKLVCANENLG